MFAFICAAEDVWTWSALLCGNHLGHLTHLTLFGI
jgi:hypothetical protein